MKLWLVRALLAAFVLFLLCIGGLVAGVALHDPDTCWLLALGRWSVQHNFTLPMVDPISTGVGDQQRVSAQLPLVQYQWLPQIVFFLIYQTFSLPGLLLLTATVLCLGYVVVPLVLFRRAKAPYVISLPAVFISTILAASRFLTRPQIFSFLLCSVLLNVLLARDWKDTRVAWRQTLWSTLILLIWVNFHLFFPLGVVLLLVVHGSRLLEWLLSCRTFSFPALPIVLGILLSGLATLINPWGTGIWVFFLRLFRSGINVYVEENAPLPLADPSAILLIVFFLAVAVCNIIMFRRLSAKHFPIVAVPLAVSGLYLGFSHSRLISFSPLFLMGSLAEVFYYCRKTKTDTAEDTSDAADKQSMETILRGIVEPLPVFLAFSSIVLLCGTVLIIRLIPPVLPQPSAGFRAPFQGIEWLRKHPQTGKLLNDPQFGSMMSWYLPHTDVFIDTRFSFFDEQRVIDYQNISLTAGDWQRLLDKYQFDWAFMPPDIPITPQLTKLGWHVLYSDPTCVVLRKSNS